MRGREPKSLPSHRSHRPTSAQDLEIIPVLNKIDLPGADVDACVEEVENTLGLDCSDAIPASAKVGTGVPEILEAIVQRVRPRLPLRDTPANLRHALQMSFPTTGLGTRHA